ncbi:Elongation factor G [Thiorhodovibrio litoralis]|nr:GTP-binding protein [Thiorhodovibrio winogradskyi]WPL10514.1 Elongation factor G [Thiorhodovibrio litoralis]
MTDHTHKLQHVRNIGIVAHVDAGKTTLTERILFYTGALHKIGEVHEGAAHMDWMAEERQHGITITAAVTRAPWREHLLQIIDTPGHVDFTIEVERAMRVLDGLVLVLDGVRGVEPQTETVWRQRGHFKLPTLFFINKMDRPGADFAQAMAAIGERLGVQPIAVTLPLPERNAVIDLIRQELLEFHGEQGEEVVRAPCPQALWSEAAGLRESLLLAAAEVDDTLAEPVLAGEPVAPAALLKALRRGVLNGDLFPCFGGSALRNLGVQPLLDAVVDLLPAPTDRPAMTAQRFEAAAADSPQPATESITIGGDGPLAALVFKVQLWDGRRHCFTRVYRNRVRPGDSVAFIGADGQVVKEHVARIFDIDAGKKTKLDEAGPGQIVLLAGLRHAATGDTLCDPEHVFSLERIETRTPVLSLAIEPTSSAEEEKLLEALDKVAQEDPTLKVEEDPETGQRLLRGMGELHLQIVIERLEREFHLRVRSGRPSVALRESIGVEISVEDCYQRPASPDGKHPEVKASIGLTLTPGERGSGVQILDEPQVHPAGNELSEEQRRALREGLQLSLSSGPLQGAPVEDVAIRVHRVDLFGQASTPEALGAAAARALRKGLSAAAPVVLHPLMRVDLVVPEDNLGHVLGDLQARHAVIRATVLSDGGGEREARVQCAVALESLLGYATELRSLTQGRGQFSMQFERFDAI